MVLGIFGAACGASSPIYFKALRSIEPVDMRRPPNRLVGSGACGFAIRLEWLGRNQAGASQSKGGNAVAVAALLIGGNWLLYVYAVEVPAVPHPHRKSRLLYQSARDFLRAGSCEGKAVVAAMDRGRHRGGGHHRAGTGRAQPLWISLTLCASFATYGLLRKIAPVEAVAGLAMTPGCSFPSQRAGWSGTSSRASRSLAGRSWTSC